MNVHRNLQLETARRRAAGWPRFYSIINVLKESDPRDGARLFNTAESNDIRNETWSPAKAKENVLGVTKRAMER